LEVFNAAEIVGIRNHGELVRGSKKWGKLCGMSGGSGVCKLRGGNLPAYLKIHLGRHCGWKLKNVMVIDIVTIKTEKFKGTDKKEKN
jgi:hypothetical protein